MKKNSLPSLWLLAIAFSLGPVAAHADTFTFSYLFGDGLVVTGSFDGTENGAFIENVANVSLSFAGTAVNGPVYLASFHGSDYVAAVIVSFEATQNNFFFSDVDLAGGDFAYESLFYVQGGVAVASFAQGAAQDDPVVGGSWTLQRASVPDHGATLPLLAFGLAVIGWSRRYLV